MSKTIRLKNGLLKIVPGERFTPFSLAQKLGAKVILESASFHKGRERWSVLLLKEAFRVAQDAEGIFLEQNNKRFRINSQARDILDVMLYFAQQHSVAGYDFPIPAGGIGYVSYEAAARFDKIHLQDKKDSVGIPESYFIVGSVFLIFDHYTDSIIIMALNYKENPIDLEAAITEVEAKINDLDFNFMNPPDKEYEARILPVPGDKENYMEGVKKVREEIIKGNLIQGVLSRRVFVETELPALEAYRNLRSMNPSPYLFLLDFDGFQLFGSSPEVHVKVKNKKVEIRPIAGTRKRGKDEQEELALEKDLLSDEKELAEHLMLVDLARNDIGRVCVPGSVHVTENMIIEKYSHVMHIVSQVEGVLEKKFNGTDLLRATFPAGTVSGAPKISAMEILDKLEPEKRGFYAGVVGWLEADGSLNSCIAIRTALKQGNRMILQAGAGIVYDSDPEKEFEETQNKLRAAAKAIGVEV